MGPMAALPNYPLAPPTTSLVSELDAVRDAVSFPVAWGFARRKLPRGRERILVLPGYLSSDAATWVLRTALADLGHEVHGWGLGLNRGNAPALLPKVIEVAEALSTDRPIHLVGWSLGGYLAREVARDIPERIVQVITLASPVVGGPKYTVTGKHYERNGEDLDKIEAAIQERETRPITVPITAYYSPKDAIVSPGACIDRVNPQTEHVEVNCSHLGIGLNAQVVSGVAERIARGA